MLKALIHYIEKNELRGNREIRDQYDLVNSPECLPYKTGGDLAQAFATKTIHRTLNPVKSLKLNVSVGQSAQEDSLCEDKNPLLVDDKIKSLCQRSSHTNYTV